MVNIIAVTTLLLSVVWLISLLAKNI